MKYYAVIFDRITPSSTNNMVSKFIGSSSYHTPPQPGMREAVNYIGFHNDFIKPQEIQRWWHYMESLYIIGTDWSSKTLSEHFTQTAQAHGVPRLHIVLEVNLHGRFGWLPKDAWEWIDNEAANIPRLKSRSEP
jgi:hypothetical protein